MKKNSDSWNTYNTDHHVAYTDDEIELVLSHLPVPQNCVILGKVLQRSQGAVRQIFEKAYMPHAIIKKLKEETGENRTVSKYNNQIQKVAKKLKLIKGYNIFKYDKVNPNKKKDKDA